MCQKVVRQANGWVHLSLGRLLRASAESKDPQQAADAGLIKTNIAAGNLVPLVSLRFLFLTSEFSTKYFIYMSFFFIQNIILQLVETQMNTNMSAIGILMDGFPRDMDQVQGFEEKVSFI